jgi:hypothetical protein
MVFEKILGDILMKSNLKFRSNTCALLILGLMIMASCSSISYIPIEIANLPPEPVSEKVQSLTLINRAVNNRFEDYKGDSLQQAFYQKQFNTDTILYDLKAADTLLIALGNLLFESGRFDVVIPEDRLYQSASGSNFPSAMTWEEAGTLATEFNTDAILSIDYIRWRITTQYNKETLYDQSSNQFFSGYHATMKVFYESLYRLYYPAEKEIVNNILISDTLLWHDFDYEIRPLFTRFTTVKSAMIEAGIHSALRLSEKIAPAWWRVNRGYFSKGHPSLVQAHQALGSGDWDTAIGLWHALAESTGSKSVISKAEFNLALAYEMYGNIEEAIDWGLKSYNRMYRPITYSYLEKLNVRLKQLESK